MKTLSSDELYEVLKVIGEAEIDAEAVGVVVREDLRELFLKNVDAVAPEQAKKLQALIGIAIHFVPDQVEDCRVFYVRDELHEYLSECHRRKAEVETKQTAKQATNGE